jgi:hypothetical protein
MSEPVGSLGEEAGRLLAAMEEWLSGAREKVGATVGATVGAAAGDLGASGHTGPECRICPVCQGLHLLRTARPEVFDHLTEAGMALLAALRATVEASERAWARPRPDAPVERIDIS